MFLFRYATAADIEFVRRAIRAIGRCAIKLEKSAEKCIHVLLELIENGFNPVVQESIIVIKVTFHNWQVNTLVIINCSFLFKIGYFQKVSKSLREYHWKTLPKLGYS